MATSLLPCGVPMSGEPSIWLHDPPLPSVPQDLVAKMKDMVKQAERVHELKL